MKRKLFSLMTLLLCAVTGSMAQTELFSWTSKTGISNTDISAGNYTFTNAAPGDWLNSVSGGTVLMVVPSNGNMRIRGSQLAFNSNASYFKITLSEVLAAGDQILINSSGNTNNLWFSLEASRPSKESDAVAVIVQGTTYTIAPGNGLIGEDEFYIWRAGSTTQVGTVTITRPAPSTDPVIYADDASIKATESGVEVTEDIAVTGANLTGSTLTATLSPAVAGLSVTLDTDAITDGSISATATLHYTTTENASGETTLTLSDGTTSKDVTITYKAKVSTTVLKTISGNITWDIANDITGEKDNGASGDAYDAENVYADITELSFANTFDSEALAFQGQYPYRGGSNKFAQRGTLHFRTSVAGWLTVYFSNTGSKNNGRYVKVTDVSGDQTGSVEADGTTLRQETFYVAAGDVYVTGTPDALRFMKLVFTATETVTVSNAEYATFVAKNKVAVPAGVTAYKVKVVGSSAKLTSVDVIAAGQAVVVYKKGANNDVVTFTATAADAADFSDNALRSSATDVTADGTQYVLAKDGDKVGFYKVKSGETIAAGKGYLVSPLGANFLSFDFDETTGVKALDKLTVSPFENSVYDLSGRKIVDGKSVNGKLQKGLYIVNGKKVVIK